MKIAVIGSGISGLSAAYFLSKKYYVDLYEKEDHFGGHSHTIDIKTNEGNISTDIGFIVLRVAGACISCRTARAASTTACSLGTR